MRKLSHTQKEFVKSVQSMIGKTRLNKIEAILISRGYIRIDGGAYKNVYRREGEPYCIKVYKYCRGWKSDSYTVPKHIEKYYVHPIFHNKKFIIQRWIRRAKKFDKLKAKKIPREITKDWRYDLHPENIKYDGHRQRIIDFANRQ